MTLQKLASKITKAEGKKSRVKIGDVREILKILCTLIVEDAFLRKEEIINVLGEYAVKLSQSKKYKNYNPKQLVKDYEC